VQDVPASVAEADVNRVAHPEGVDLARPLYDEGLSRGEGGPAEQTARPFARRPRPPHPVCNDTSGAGYNESDRH
jgi:hypothetical protein